MHCVAIQLLNERFAMPRIRRSDPWFEDGSANGTEGNPRAGIRSRVKVRVRLTASGTVRQAVGGGPGPDG